MPSQDAAVTNSQICLDRNDPFEKLLIPIVETNRKKRADYASDDNIYLNFDRAAAEVGLSPQDIVDVMVAIKNGRIANLRGREEEVKNESVADSYLDRAVYCILAYGLYLRDHGFYLEDHV